eukprot:TRINITY_DN33174_c0_g1_i1.p1 TRINITY_DN33174_c0_g1~~TRINITY_DN33174_c0_g1_i1.p1  ORF type:complete len:514 (-),score=137.76 TRINITY_DN33174_c0_g1_i1:85-1512(-)
MCIRDRNNGVRSAQRMAVIKKMEADHLTPAAQAAFLANYDALVSGVATMISESSIEAVDDLKSLGDLPKDEINPELLKETVMVKLNGGLGTGMGLDKAKSLLPVKGEDSFLDIICKQVLKMREGQGHVQFLFMNSFSTSDDTKAHLEQYSAQLNETPAELEFVQNKSPKVAQADLSPVSYPENPAMEWCPPGHGDLYAALSGSGTLKKLRDAGNKYMFVSNADNLGATMDLQILTYFSESGAPFMMEVCERTESDKKGGHLCRSKADQSLLLRESAQCAEEDAAAFQDVSKHKYFNTNNLWIHLDQLQELMDKNNGTVPLPLIKNSKTVNPKDKGSTPVFQLETAMGSAIAAMGPKTEAIVMPRTRFAPVKTCSDLLAVRSDAFVLTEEQSLVLAETRDAPPVISLDDFYKPVGGLDTMIPNGVPSLIGCDKLTIKGKVVFEADVKIEGACSFTNSQDEPMVVKTGSYKDQEVAN